MSLKTHLEINTSLSGEVQELEEGSAKVLLKTTSAMRADEAGLVHGGFVFSAADFAAMAAVNHPYVVLAKSEVKFLAPVKVGEDVLFTAQITTQDGKKSTVDVIGEVRGKPVFTGSFYTATLANHVLS